MFSVALRYEHKLQVFENKVLDTKNIYLMEIGFEDGTWMELA